MVLPFAIPSTIQVTAVLEVPVTVPVNEAVAPELRLKADGARVTVTGELMFTVVVADLLVSAALVAITTWLPLVAGAV